MSNVAAATTTWRTTPSAADEAPGRDDGIGVSFAVASMTAASVTDTNQQLRRRTFPGRSLRGHRRARYDSPSERIR